MTKPTQAQIRAVAIAICKSKTCEGINCCQWPANGGKRRDRFGQPAQCNVKLGAYDDAAKAALTAAAEVGENGLLARIKELENGLHEYACTGTDQPCGCYELYMKDKNIAAATIERCAQVADKMAPEPDGTPDGIWTATDSKLLHLANDIAAEIRALKDKP